MSEQQLDLFVPIKPWQRSRSQGSGVGSQKQGVSSEAQAPRESKAPGPLCGPSTSSLTPDPRPLTPVPAWQQGRDEAFQAIEKSAQDNFQEFSTKAADFICRYLREHGDTSGEDLTAHCIAAGIVLIGTNGKPKDARSFGPVYHRLLKQGQIVIVGA